MNSQILLAWLMQDPQVLGGSPLLTERPNPDDPELLKAARKLARDFSLDQATFYGSYGLTTKYVMEALGTRLMSDELEDFEVGAIGTTLLVARSVELSSRYGAVGTRPTEAELNVLDGYLRRSPVRTVLRRLYAPDAASDPGAKSVWDAVDWNLIRIHRVGTSCLILHGPTSTAERTDVVVKLIHFFFNEIAPVRTATAGYRNEVEPLRIRNAPVVQVLASTENWIVEEYIPGATFQEVADALASFDEAKGISGKDRLLLLRNLYVPIVEAVASLHKASGKKPHADLNPSNIIIETAPENADAHSLLEELRKGRAKVRLIDLGRNLLASDVIGRVKSPDSAFVAPEVVLLPLDAPSVKTSADTYSLGLLLSLALGFGGTAEAKRGELPLELFGFDPIIARIGADLADRNEATRLGLISTEAKFDPTDLSRLALHLRKIADTLYRVNQSMSDVNSSWAIVMEAIFPFRAASLRALRGVGRALADEDAAEARRLRYLGWCGLVMRAILYVCALACALTVVVDLVPDLVPQIVYDRMARFLGSLGFIPAKEGISFEEQRSVNMQGRLVGYTYAVASFQYYKHIFASVTFLPAPGGSLRLIAEGWMRMFSVATVTMILFAVIAWPDSWPLWSAIGLLAIALNNALVVGRQRDVLRRLKAAAEQNPALKDAIPPLSVSKTLRDWSLTMFLYVVVTFLLAISMSAGWTRDRAFFAWTIVLINVIFFTFTQAIRNGADVRASLTRSSVYAERLRVVPPVPETP